VRTISLALIAVIALPAALAVAPAASSAAATANNFTITPAGDTHASILDNGVPWEPYGFTLSTFQDGTETTAPNEAQVVNAELNAIKGAWHGNTVRLQIEQYQWLAGNATTPKIIQAAYDAKVQAAIQYALSIGLVVVINDQTEGQDGFNITNLPENPNAGTLKFWASPGMEQYKTNPNVILDPFNEPRAYISKAPGVYSNDYYVPPPGSGYVGLPALLRAIRADGYTSQLWIEEPGLGALSELGVTWPKYEITGTLGANLVYSFHHTQGLLNADPTTTGYNVEFGNLVTVRGVPVVDAEWTNRTVPYGTEGHIYEPSGDTGQCWGDAPTVIPAYFAYLAARHIGMAVWTMGNDPTDPGMDYINADGDHLNATGSNSATAYTTANSYAGWTKTAYDGGCVTPKGGRTAGAGQDIMNWFEAEDNAPS